MDAVSLRKESITYMQIQLNGSDLTDECSTPNLDATYDNDSLSLSALEACPFDEGSSGLDAGVSFDLMCDISSEEEDEDDEHDFEDVENINDFGFVCDLSSVEEEKESDEGEATNNPSLVHIDEPEGATMSEIVKLNLFMERLSYRRFPNDSLTTRKQKRRLMKTVLRDAKKCGVPKEVALELFIFNKRERTPENISKFQKSIQKLRKRIPKKMSDVRDMARSGLRHGAEVKVQLENLPEEIRKELAYKHNVRIMNTWTSPWSNRLHDRVHLSSIETHIFSSNKIILRTEDVIIYPEVNAVSSSILLSIFRRNLDSGRENRQRFARRKRNDDRNSYNGIVMANCSDNGVKFSEQKSFYPFHQIKDNSKIPKWFGTINDHVLSKRFHFPVSHPKGVSSIKVGLPRIVDWDESMYVHPWKANRTYRSLGIEKTSVLGDIYAVRSSEDMAKLSRVHYGFSPRPRNHRREIDTRQ